MRRRPGRFSRQWQRERAAQADADANMIFRLARMFGRMSPLPSREPIRSDDEVQPYRGFRAGRARMRPEDTGYDEPVTPPAAGEDAWHEHPWLAGLRDDDAVSDPVIGDD